MPDDLSSRIAAMEKAFKNMRILGTEGVEVSGSMEHGFVINAIREGEGDSGGGGGGGPATGACCIGADCSILTETDCATMGGTYQGDGTPCDPNPCVCPEISLVCDQICASLTKCGNDGFSGSGLKYLTYNQDWVVSASFASSDETCDPGTDCCSCSYSDVHGYQADYNPFTCISHETGCYGATTRTLDAACGPSASESWSIDLDGICRPHPDDPYPVGCPFGGCSASTVINSDTSASTACSASTSTNNDSVDIEETLSNEYTTAMLVSNIELILPAYDDDFNDTCEAKKIDNSFGDQSGFTICRFRPKFTFTSAPVDFTISYNENFEPQPDFGTGSPSNTPKSVNVLAGDTEVIGDEVIEPSDIGTITITDILCTPV